MFTTQRVHPKYIKRPLYEMLKALTDAEPPAYIGDHFYSTELTPEEQENLQWWCVDNVRPEWATGIGLIEAADSIVFEAVSNGNILP